MVREGDVIAAGYDAALDELRRIATHTDEFLLDLEVPPGWSHATLPAHPPADWRDRLAAASASVIALSSVGMSS